MFEEQERLERKILDIKSIAEAKVKKSNEKIDLLLTEKENMNLQITSIKKDYDEKFNQKQQINNEMKHLIETNELLEKEITFKDKTIKDEKEKNKQKNKQNFYSAASTLVSTTNKAAKVFEHMFTFASGENGKSKSIFIGLKSSSKTHHITIVKLVIASASKMVSAITTKQQSKMKKSISEGKKLMAALKIMDCKIKDCFLKSSLQAHSMELFTKMLEVIQKYYKMELPNLNLCASLCSQIPTSKCYQEKQQNPTTSEIVEIVEAYSGVFVDKQHNAVTDFKAWILTLD